MFLHQKPFVYMLGLALSDHRVQNMLGLAHKCDHVVVVVVVPMSALFTNHYLINGSQRHHESAILT